MTAVIHEASFDKLVNAIEGAKSDKDAEVVIGGGYTNQKDILLNLQ